MNVPAALAPKSSAKFRISPLIALCVIGGSGFVAGILSDFYAVADPGSHVERFALVCYAVAGLGWIWVQQHEPSGRWFISLASTVLVAAGTYWWSPNGFLPFISVPIVIAAALIGFPGVFVAGGLMTVLLILMENMGYLVLTGTLLPFAIVSMWLVLGMLAAVCMPMVQLADWSWEQFRHIQSLLEEARDRRAELERVLDELVHANRQLDLLNERLAATRLMAEEANKAKATFVAKVSHEFRTPLNMIIGLVDLLVETPDVYGETLPTPLQDDLRIVHRNCRHLASMINDVLDLSQTEIGHLSLRKEWVDMRQEIESAVAVVQPLIEKKRLQLRVHVEENLSEVYCDRTRIRQVVLNLVSNAARYTDAGEICVEVVRMGQSVVANVRDTGPGIHEHELQKIFEPFHQGANGTWRDRSGAGLGLAISRQFIELHGGHIWVESVLGQGSAFSFRLPIMPSTLPLAAAGRWLNEEWVWRERNARPELPQSELRRRVVLLDETGDLYPLFSRSYQDIEFVDTRTLEEVETALDECPAHVIILNTDMPEKLWPLLDEARSAITDTPIIGYSMPPRMERAVQRGAVNYLVKPVTRADLRTLLPALNGTPRRILVVDDDDDFRQLMTRMVQSLDETIVVEPARSGSEALEIMRLEPPDIVLLDVSMPNLDGWQVLAHKNQDEAIRDIPVTIVSAQDPYDNPVASGVMVGTLGSGISVTKLLRCSLELSVLLLSPEEEPDPAPG